MTAQIVGFISRAEAGLRAPRSVSRNITPGNGGVSSHYGGGHQSAAELDADHARCVSTWLSWQAYHMDSHGWVDIAYTGGFCNHGYAFAGRGVGVRTAANGTNAGNQNYYAVVWIGGEGQTPTQAAFDALAWWIVQLRENGKAGNAVKPHWFFKPTGCPGDPLAKYVAYNDGNADISTPTPKSPSTSLNQVQHIQTALEVTIDDKWGPKTDKIALQMRAVSRAKSGWPTNRDIHFHIGEAQSVINTKVDGIWGPLSQAALVQWIKDFQNIINVESDGLWGPKTDAKFISLRSQYLNNY